MAVENLEAQLIETWAIHNRINLYVLDAISAEALGDKLGSKGRNVTEQFAHIHNVRLMWLDSAAPTLIADLKLQKIEKDAPIEKAELRASLEASGQAIEGLLKQAIEAGGKVKGFKPHVTAFLGYLISHESYHRAEIGIILTQAGDPLDKKIAFGMWEWGVR